MSKLDIKKVYCLITMNQEIVVIQLSAILTAYSFDNAQPVIKWGGLVIAVGTVVATLLGN